MCVCVCVHDYFVCVCVCVCVCFGEGGWGGERSGFADLTQLRKGLYYIMHISSLTVVR